MFQTDIAVVPCNVPLLFSRPILSALGMHYDIAAQEVSFAVPAIRDQSNRPSSFGRGPIWWQAASGGKATLEAARVDSDRRTDEVSSIPVEISDEAKAEIIAAETKLAALKQKHGVAPPSRR